MGALMRVPFHVPSIGREEIEEVVRTLESGWLTSGPRTAEFETSFRQYLGVPHALAVNSCTAGLQLALAALDLGPGAEVITTPLTFCATVNCILHAGAKPVLADIDDDGNVDPECVNDRINEFTRAIMPVHLAGLPCDMRSLWATARRHGLRVVEDAAHAAGAAYRGWPIGAGNPDSSDYSDATVFSFYATKNITTGEGGMVASHNGVLAERMRCLCLHGISKDAWNRYSEQGRWFYQVLEAGFKSNLSDIQSAIGLHQLKRLDEFTRRREHYARLYTERLAGCELFDLPAPRPDRRHAWHLFILRLNLDRITINRDEFIEALRMRGIGTSVHFIPIPMHPFFESHAWRPENQCPRAMALYPRILSLPLYPAMTESQVEYVADAVVEIARRHRHRVSAAPLTRVAAAG